MAGMTQSPLCLKIDEWPTDDRERWISAQEPARFLDPPKPASTARREIVTDAYGQWLAFLSRQGLLDVSCPPGERVTDERLKQFVAELESRVAPVSVTMMTGALLRMLEVIEPDRGWETLRSLYNHHKLAGKPKRDKLGTMVAA